MAYNSILKESNATFRGRANTFRTPGRAGTAGQNIMSVFNPAGSGRIAVINQVVIDLYQTVIKAVGTPPPIIRILKLTAASTGGTAITKVPKDSALVVGNSVVTILGDASSEGSSGTAVANAAAVNGAASITLTQEYAPRLITAVGYELFDRTELLEGKEILIRAGEGVMLRLDYTAVGQNPVTDMWIAGADWYEYVG